MPQASALSSRAQRLRVPNGAGSSQPAGREPGRRGEHAPARRARAGAPAVRTPAPGPLRRCAPSRACARPCGAAGAAEPRPNSPLSARAEITAHSGHSATSRRRCAQRRHTGRPAIGADAERHLALPPEARTESHQHQAQAVTPANGHPEVSISRVPGSRERGRYLGRRRAQQGGPDGGGSIHWSTSGRSPLSPERA